MTEQAPTRGMSEREAELASRIYAAMQDYSINSERGKQAQEFRAGISDLGYCSERLRRMLDKQTPDDTDMLPAFIGTAIGDHVEKAIESRFETKVITQADVTVTLELDGRTFEVPGHPDLILADEGIVLDAKTAYGLQLARRVGADQQKQFQRHCYGKGAWEAGYFGDLPLEEVMVGNVWVDRSGVDREVHVELEPFNQEVLDDAAQWLDGVIYAYLNNEEAMKEPAREVCAATCGFFKVCRAYDTDVTGLLTDPVVVEAVKMYREGLDMEKEGRRLKAEAKPALKDVSGTTGEFSVRWVHVNETVVPETKRAAYDRLDLRRMK